jgi:uncharacterized lipoprotein YbaY
MRYLTLVLGFGIALSSASALASGGCKKQFAECTAPATANVQTCKQQEAKCFQMSSSKRNHVAPPTDAQITPPAVK